LQSLGASNGAQRVGSAVISAAAAQLAKDIEQKAAAFASSVTRGLAWAGLLLGGGLLLLASSKRR